MVARAEGQHCQHLVFISLLTVEMSIYPGVLSAISFPNVTPELEKMAR